MKKDRTGKLSLEETTYHTRWSQFNKGNIQELRFALCLLSSWIPLSNPRTIKN